MKWVKETLPPRERLRWLLTTTRLSMRSFAGTARTLVAVGTSREDSMFATTRLLAPRSGMTVSSDVTSGSAGFCASRGVGLESTLAGVGFARSAPPPFVGAFAAGFAPESLEPELLVAASLLGGDPVPESFEPELLVAASLLGGDPVPESFEPELLVAASLLGGDPVPESLLGEAVDPEDRRGADVVSPEPPPAEPLPPFASDPPGV